MKRTTLFAVASVLFGLTMAHQAHAQFYPMGYRGFGWGGFGSHYANDPGSGFMRSLGYYKQAEGKYDIEKAQARSINIDNIVKWNKAVKEAQAAHEADQRKKDAAKQAADAEAGRRMAIEDGSALNKLLDRIYEFPTPEVKATLIKTPLSAETLRDIPFSPGTEAMSICLDQMTADDAWPSALGEARFADERKALRAAVSKALAEDQKGTVSEATMKGIDDAVEALHTKLDKLVPNLSPLYVESDEFLKTLAGLNRMFNNSRIKEIIASLSSYKGGSLADLVIFMHSYNLRFAPATSDRQKAIYQSLVPLLSSVATGGEAQAAGGVDPKAMRAAASEVFKGMSWKDVKAAK